MSTKIKLYIIHPTTKVLHFARFPASLDVKTAFAKGWMWPSSAQKHYKVDIKSIAVELPMKGVKIAEGPTVGKILVNAAKIDHTAAVKQLAEDRKEIEL